MSDTTYFDLTTRGIGFVNDVRSIKPENGDRFTAVSLSALRGKAGEANYTRFDCTPAGDEVIETLRLLKPYVEGNRKVLVAFDIGNVHSQAFLYKNGDKAGEPGASLRGRLIRISWAKVDGNVIYNRSAVAA